MIDPWDGLSVQEIVFARIEGNFHLRPAEFSDQAAKVSSCVHKIFTVDFPCKIKNNLLSKRPWVREQHGISR